jgi:hypothetical protein
LLKLGQAKQSLQFPAIEADHGFAVNDGDRRGSVSELQKFLKRGRILPNILRLEDDTLLRKKLFLLIATASAGLRVHNHVFRHGLLPGGEYRCP